MTREKKIIISSVLVLGVFMALLGFAVFQQLRPGIGVNIVVLPDDSLVQLDGTIIKAGRRHLSPGVHTFKASRQFFDDVSKQVNTKSLTKNQTIYLLPGATSPEAIRWLRDHPKIQQARESAGGLDAGQQQQALTAIYPIISKLPHETLDFRIDYAISKDNKVSFAVVLFPVGDPSSANYQPQLDLDKKEAVSYMQDQGLDVSKATITYRISP